jgi:hypothetical protein
MDDIIVMGAGLYTFCKHKSTKHHLKLTSSALSENIPQMRTRLILQFHRTLSPTTFRATHHIPRRTVCLTNRFHTMSKNEQQGKFEPVKEAQEQNLPG